MILIAFSQRLEILPELFDILSKLPSPIVNVGKIKLVRNLTIFAKIYRNENVSNI